MQKVLLLIATLFIILMNTIETNAQSAKDFAEAWEKHHLSNILPSNARHRDLQKYLAALKETKGLLGKVGRTNDREAIKPYLYVHAKDGSWQVLHKPSS